MRTYAKPTWTSKAPALNLRLGSELGALAVLVWPTLAYAINCGDTLGPGGSAALDGPLACVESPALKIEGPFTLDLKGFTVSCVAQDGGLTGTGIEVAGVRAKVHNGTITDCEKGLVVEGGGRHVLKRLTVTSPDVKDDDQGIAFDNGIAFQVKSDRNWFIENTVEKYAGEGFRLGDDGVPADRNLLKGNKAISNANHGFRVRLGERNLLVLNRAEDNATEGFRSQGGRNRFVSNTAIGNGDEGFRLRDEEAVDNWLIGNIAKRNGLEPCDPEPPISDANPGIAITNDAAKNTIINNITKDNCIGIAIETDSLNNKIIGNVALDSRFLLLNLPLDLADGNVDCDHNKWHGNRFEGSVAGPDFGDLSPGCIR